MSEAPAAAPSLAEELRAALGADAVATDPGELERFRSDTYWKAVASDAAGASLGRPDLVVRPATEEDVATVLRLANERGVPVVPRGGGSGSQGGAVPVEGGIVLDLRRLDRVVAIDVESLTVTAQAGVNGLALERELNARGLMLPHYPASVEWATVGGYVAARGSGVLSTRYGKIEDLLLSLQVVLPSGELVDMLPVPRHAVGPELTQLFIGSEGLFGVITRATLQLAPLPEARRFEAVAFDSVAQGVAALRQAMARGYRPSVIRMYDETATIGSLGPVGGRELSGVCAVLAFEGDRRMVDAEATGVLDLACAGGATVLEPGLGEVWWDRRYDFYRPPHHPQLPSIWGTIEAVATYSRIMAVYEAVKAAIEKPYADTGLRLRIHFSHWYPWGTMIYARFVVPDGGSDGIALHDRIWADGIEAILGAGGLMNDHHGVGLKLAPFMRAQHGAALDTLRRIKEVLDPNGIMNPGKLGL